MAILANRVKTVSTFLDLIDSMKTFVIKFLSAILMLLSLSLWSFLGESKITSRMFDISSLVINPIASCLDATSAKILEIRELLTDIWNARQENIALKLENARLQNLLEQYSYLKAENNLLRTQLKFTEKDTNQVVVSGRLITVVKGIYNHSGVINLGTKDGIKENYIVTSEGKIIGKITFCGENYSKVMFITDPQSRIPVITSVSGEKAIFAGNGDSRGQLLYLPDNNNVQLGEYIMSSGDGKYYPYGIPIAKVVEKTDGYIYAQPIVNLSNVQFVSIIPIVSNN